MGTSLVATRSVTGVLLRAAFCGSLVASCTTTPTDSAAPILSAEPSAPVATAEPDATPAAARVAIRWERITALANEGDIRDVVRGDRGWVAIGRCFIERAFECPLAWQSSDGTTWSRHPIPHRLPDVEMHGVASGAPGFVIVGSEGDDDVGGDRVWTSPDGRSWTRLGRIPAGKEHVYVVALAPTGTILVGNPNWEGEEPRIDTFSSTDGKDWTRLRPEDFGVDLLHVETFESTAKEVVLTGVVCDGCDLDHKVWTSSDGVSWTEVGAFRGGITSFVTLGQVRVASVVECFDEFGDCRTQLWTSTADGPWVRTLDRDDIESPAIVIVGSTFLVLTALYGQDESRYVALASSDGLTWAEASSEGLPGANDECTPSGGWLIAAGQTILFGSNDCGSWRGTVE
jgi:hypothetical protein